MSGVSDAVRQQRRVGRAFPRAPTSSNHCKSLLLFQELETITKTLIFFTSFSPVLQRVFSSHAPFQYLQRSVSSTHSSRFQTTHMSRVWLLHRSATVSDAPEPDLFALFTTYWIQVRCCSVSAVKWIKSAHCWWIHRSEIYCFSLLLLLRCYSCLVVFGGLNSVKSHIQQAHCDVFHKCPSCPMAFKSAASIQSHITSQHPALTDRQTTYVFMLGWRHRILWQMLEWIDPFLFYRSTGWSLNVSCVTQFLQTRLSYTPTLKPI